MFRTAHILLTTASLLVCPLNCLGHAAGNSDGAEPKQAQGCRCCQHATQSTTAASGPAQGDDSPSAPNDDCGCGNCLCRGAILTEDDLPVDAAAGALFPAPTDELAVGILAAEIGLFSAADSPPSDFKSSGRQIRLVLESLLI